VHAPGTLARLRGVELLADAAEGAARVPAPLARPQAPDAYDAAEWRLVRVELLLHAGRLAEAGREAEAVTGAAQEGGWHWLACRARLLWAEAALRHGDLGIAEAALAVMRAETAARGYAVEGVLAELVAGAVERIRGQADRAARTLTAARQQAAEMGLGVEVACRRLRLDETPTLALRDDGGENLLTERQLGEWSTERYVLVVDVPHRRVKVRRRWVDLARRGALLDLARVLAERPGELVPVDRLTRDTWNVEYHPLRHHSRVTMAISRLRKLVGVATIEGGPEGYRFVVGGPWAVVCSLADGPRRSDPDPAVKRR
jgi:hypothetical protein